MADILVHTIQFVDDNPYGTFVAGDVVTIFYNPDADLSPFLSSTTGYTVKQNDVTITEGDDIFYQNYNYKIETSQNAQICNGTTLVVAVRQISNFPYVFSYIEPDYPSCAVDPTTCNLLISGTPVINSASGPSESDGEILINAQSTYPIEYKLGAPFLYGDGTAQSTGLFTGLLPGEYRVYVRDSLNCSTDVLVTVGYNDTYSTLYRLEYYDPVGGKTRIDITKRAYDGPIIEVKGAGIPFERSLRGEGSTDKFESILSTQATFNIVSETDFYFQQLFTNNPDEFRLNFYKEEIQDVSELVEWTNTNSGFDGDLSGWSTYNSGTNIPWAYAFIPFFITAGAKISFTTTTDVSETLYQTKDITIGDLVRFEYKFGRSGVGNSAVVIGLYAMFLQDGVPVEEVLIDNLNSYDIGSLTQNVKNLTAPVTCNGVGFKLTSNTNANIDYVFGDFLITHYELETTPGSLSFVLKWAGKVLPQQYEEQYKAPPYYVSVTATDGLPSLKDYIFLQDDGQRFNSNERQIYLIAYILKKLKLDLPIRVACNLYATNMDQGDLNDPLDQAYEDTDSYYLVNEEPTLDFVLRTILETYGASIIQEDGRWNIVRVEEKRGEYDYRDFDKDGNVISAGSYDPIVNVDTPPATNCLHWADRNQHMMLMPGYGKIIVYYHLGLRGNILENGDFRLKSIYNPSTNTYSYTIDKYGFQLINAGYSITESFERTSETNVSYLIRSIGFTTTGEAYIQSDQVFVKMGIHNALKIKLRFKLPNPPTTIPYQKVRLRIKYGDYYLRSDGLWTSDANELVFFVNKFNEYTEVEALAYAPDVAAASGYNLDVRLYHSYAYHADYTNFADIISVTADNVDLLPLGTRKQVRSSQLSRVNRMYYYELQERQPSSNLTMLDVINERGNYDPSSTNDFPSSGGSGTAGAILKGDVWTVSVNSFIQFTDMPVFIGDKIIALVDSPGNTISNWGINWVPEEILPSGFDADNDKMWVLNAHNPVAGKNLQFEDGTIANGSVDGSFWIDAIELQYLVNGASPVDTIVREIKAESRNTAVLEKHVYHGSYGNVIQTISIFDAKISSLSRFANTTNSIVTSNVLSADLIYAGYLRNSAGVGFSEWKRDGVSESTSLHAILLQSYAAQYRKSWRKITGSLYSNSTYMTFLKTIKETFDDDRLYMPIAMTIDDKNNKVTGEFLELTDITQGGGSNGSVTSPFSRAFTNGFGSGYN